MVERQTNRAQQRSFFVRLIKELVRSRFSFFAW